MQKALGQPVLIGAGGGSLALERIILGAGTHSEDWLQSLIFAHPEILPIAQIEPGFGQPLPAAREIACGHGSIDNLYLTPDGDIVLVETKLWRNPQARREVVAQALDYVSALMRLSYEAFEAAVCAAQGTSFKRLHHLVAEMPDALEESAFIDGVSRNLALGRMLVIVLGDGIREESEALAGLLQSHAGAHFTFALVELATWRETTTGNILAVPHTLAKTVLIERGVLRIANGVPVVGPVPVTPETKAYTLSEARFYEELAKKDPTIPAHLKAFIASLAPLGVEPDLKASLNLKVEIPGLPRPFNLGYISRSGKLSTNPVAWLAPVPIAMAYNQTLAALIGGSVATGNGMYVSTNGVSTPSVSALLPEHAEAWKAAIAELIDAVRAHAEELSA